jgi:hypothetical protein
VNQQLAGRCNWSVWRRAGDVGNSNPQRVELVSQAPGTIPRGRTTLAPTLDCMRLRRAEQPVKDCLRAFRPVLKVESQGRYRCPSRMPISRSMM